MMGTPPPTPIERLEARINVLEQAIHSVSLSLDALTQLLRAEMIATRDSRRQGREAA